MDHNAYYSNCGTVETMRTEEEATYDLNEQIFGLYDTGISLDDIAGRLKTSVEYVESVLKGVPVEVI